MPAFYHQSFGSVKINLFCVEAFCQKASYHMCSPELLPELPAQDSVRHWALGRGVRNLQTGLPEISTSPLLRDHCLCVNKCSAAQALYSLHWAQLPSYYFSSIFAWFPHLNDFQSINQEEKYNSRCKCIIYKASHLSFSQPCLRVVIIQAASPLKTPTCCPAGFSLVRRMLCVSINHISSQAFERDT